MSSNLSTKIFMGFNTIHDQGPALLSIDIHLNRKQQNVGDKLRFKTKIIFIILFIYYILKSMQ